MKLAGASSTSIQTMVDVYAAWIDGSRQADIEAIRRAMEARSPLPTESSEPGLDFDLQLPFPPQSSGTGLAPAHGTTA
jgi:hypothetical protein